MIRNIYITCVARADSIGRIVGRHCLVAITGGLATSILEAEKIDARNY